MLCIQGQNRHTTYITSWQISPLPDGNVSPLQLEYWPSWFAVLGLLQVHFIIYSKLAAQLPSLWKRSINLVTYQINFVNKQSYCQFMDVSYIILFFFFPFREGLLNRELPYNNKERLIKQQSPPEKQQVFGHRYATQPGRQLSALTGEATLLLGFPVQAEPGKLCASPARVPPGKLCFPWDLGGKAHLKAL